MHQLHTKSPCSKNKTNKTWISKNGIVENSLRILDLCRTPETDSTNPWGSIEPRLRTTGLKQKYSIPFKCSLSNFGSVINSFALHHIPAALVHSLLWIQPVLDDWCNKGCGMCYPVCGMVHIKEPLLLIGNSSPCGGSRFPLLLSEWFFTICLTTYNRK